MILLPHLTHLEEAGLIKAATESPEMAYLFRHALIQEAAYDSLLRQDRRRLHGVVGAILESLPSGALDEMAALLAYHFGEAGEQTKALHYLIRAGNHSAAIHANREAATHYRHALTLAREQQADVPWLELYMRLGRAQELSGQHQAAIESYREMAVQAQSLGDQRLELASLIARAVLRATPTPLFDAEQAWALTEQALPLATSLGDQAAEVRIHWAKMLASYYRESTTANALAYGEHAIRLARALGLREQLAYVLHDIPYAYLEHSQPEKAQAAHEEALAIWRELGNLPMLSDALVNRSYALLQLGYPDQARAAVEEALTISQTIGNLWGESFALGALGDLAMNDCNIAEALRIYTRVPSLSIQGGFVASLAYMYQQLGWLYSHMGVYERARGLVREASEVAQRYPQDPSFQAENFALLARIEHLAGELDAAEVALAQAQAALPPNQPTPLLVESARLELAQARGDHLGVLTQVNAHLAQHPRIYDRRSQAQLLYIKARALMALGQLEEAETTIVQAHAEVYPSTRPILGWRVLSLLSQCLHARGAHAEAAARHAEAREIIQAVAASTGDAALTASFLAQPEVRALLGNQPIP